MTFDITPATPGTLRRQFPDSWLQFMDEGAAVGDANVAVVDFVGDLAALTVTRGVGENSHIITVRIEESTCVPFFLDEFTGTGLLSAHTPDEAPAGFMWEHADGGTMTLDGTGLVKPTDATSALYFALYTTQGWTPVPLSPSFTITLVATMPG